MQPWAGMKIDKVAGMEARGFILGGAVAHQVSAGFIPIRKKGKLPHKRVSIAYSLEYGLDEMEMHEDAVTKGEKVILVDDLIATGGTAEGAVKLLQAAGRRRARRLLHHRPAGARRRRQDPEARRAGAHADLVRGALNAAVDGYAECLQLRRDLAEQEPHLELAECDEHAGHPFVELARGVVGLLDIGDERESPAGRPPSAPPASAPGCRSARRRRRVGGKLAR